ncbi:hypothetical protein TeGR_g3722, partial [Tetraparma gracilis]
GDYLLNGEGRQDEPRKKKVMKSIEKMEAMQSKMEEAGGVGTKGDIDLESMIKAMSAELGALETGMLKSKGVDEKGKGVTGRKKGRGKEKERDALIDDISNQVATRLKAMWT